MYQFARLFALSPARRRRRVRPALTFSDRVLDQQGRRYRAAQLRYFLLLWAAVIAIALGVVLFEGPKL
tara:strand:+ start:5150 stop:5353 length:204 start_codon:yes stop_codon:yes gene_type:complete